MNNTVKAMNNTVTCVLKIIGDEQYRHFILGEAQHRHFVLGEEQYRHLIYFCELTTTWDNIIFMHRFECVWFIVLAFPALNDMLFQLFQLFFNFCSLIIHYTI